MPFCSKCGEKLDDKVKFCPNCKAPVRRFSKSAYDKVKNIQEKNQAQKDILSDKINIPDENMMQRDISYDKINIPNEKIIQKDISSYKNIDSPKEKSVSINIPTLPLVIGIVIFVIISSVTGYRYNKKIKSEIYLFKSAAVIYLKGANDVYSASKTVMTAAINFGDKCKNTGMDPDLAMDTAFSTYEFTDYQSTLLSTSETLKSILDELKKHPRRLNKVYKKLEIVQNNYDQITLFLIDPPKNYSEFKSKAESLMQSTEKAFVDAVDAIDKI